MKKLNVYILSILMLGISIINTGCMGSWKLTSSLYGWNKKVSGNKYINNVIFWVLFWNVYGITILIDGVILNLVEFWTGSNPLTLKPGDKEQQIVKGKDGNKYEITATQNRFDIVALTGNKTGEKSALVFNQGDNSWRLEKNGTSSIIVRYHEDINKAEVFGINGSVQLVDLASINLQSVMKQR